MADSPLGQELKALIAAQGPISVARFMADCLMHPHHGYYRQGVRVGAQGDFITAPEISQMFGELLGLWLVDRWVAMDRPAPVLLVELGPGRGTLMADALRAMAVMPGMRDAVELHLVESNLAFRALQQEKFAGDWHDSLAAVPHGPMLLIANEFFDALPVRQFVRGPDNWVERGVGLNEEGQFCFTALAPDDGVPDFGPAAPGTVREICPMAEGVAAALADRAGDHPCAGLIIDYGHGVSGFGETIQAVRDHKMVDLFDRPGESDLTAHVDFAALSKTFEQGGARALGPVGQGDFLNALGLDQRAETLRQDANAQQKQAIDAAISRLTGPDQMGTLFKVLGFQSPGLAPPPGFDRVNKP